MNQKKIIAELKKARIAIDRAIEFVEGDQPEETRIQVATCTYGKEAIFEGEKINRGLCKKCYHFLRNRIEKGETSWEELESQGLASPKSKTGRKPKQLAQGLNAKIAIARNKKKN